MASLIVKDPKLAGGKKALDLQPETARVVRAWAGTGTSYEQVTVGDVVRVRPGERIAGRRHRGSVAIPVSTNRLVRASRFLSKKLKAILSSAFDQTAPARSSCEDCGHW